MHTKTRNGMIGNNDSLYSSRIILSYVDYLEKKCPNVEIAPLLEHAEMKRH